MSALTYTFRTVQRPDGIFVYEFNDSRPETPLYCYGPISDEATAAELVKERVAQIEELQQKLLADLLCFGTAIQHVDKDGKASYVAPREFYDYQQKPKEQP